MVLRPWSGCPWRRPSLSRSAGSRRLGCALRRRQRAMRRRVPTRVSHLRPDLVLGRAVHDMSGCGLAGSVLSVRRRARHQGLDAGGQESKRDDSIRGAGRAKRQCGALKVTHSKDRIPIRDWVNTGVPCKAASCVSCVTGGSSYWLIRAPSEVRTCYFGSDTVPQRCHDDERGERHLVP